MLNVADSRQTDRQAVLKKWTVAELIEELPDSYANPHYSESRKIQPICYHLISLGQFFGCFPQNMCGNRLTFSSSQCVHMYQSHSHRRDFAKSYNWYMHQISSSHSDFG